MGQRDMYPRLKSGAICLCEQPHTIRVEIFALPVVGLTRPLGRNLNFRVFAFWRIVVKKDAPLADPDVAVH
jgi:hypothetical protein